jgi:CBS domain-containing protein
MTTPVIVVQPDESLGGIAALLHQHRISAVPVVVDDGAVVGLVSEYDVLSSPAGRTAQEVMTTAVLSVTEDTDVDDVRQLLVDRRIHRVPVVSGGKLVGIVSRADIVALIFTEWVCPVCGESVRGGHPPAVCPRCHGADGFVKQVQPPGP